MEFAGDTLPLRQPLAQPLLHLARDTGNAQPYDPRDQKHRSQTGQTQKPPGLVKRRLDDHVDRSPGFIPDTVVVTGNHEETIRARRYVRVEGLTSRAGVLPVGVDPI